jgi:hypothetical protein
MSLLPLSIGRGLALSAVTLTLLSRPSHAQEESKKADATPPATTTSIPTATEPLPGESSYKQFKQDLFKPFEAWKSQGATQPVLATRPVAPPVSLKQSEDAEKDRNWLFNGLNELKAGNKRDNLEKLSNPNPTWGERSKSSIEKYYEQSGRNTGATNTLNDWINAWTRDPSGLNSMNPMNFMIPGSEQLLKNMILPGDTNSVGKKSDNASSKNSPTQDLADDDRDNRLMDEFKRMIDPTLPPLPPKGYNPMKDPFAEMNSLLKTGLGGTGPATTQLPGSQTIGAMNPVLGAANPMSGAFQLPTAANAPVKPIIPDSVQKMLAQPEKPVMVKPVDPASMMPRRKF